MNQALKSKSNPDWLGNPNEFTSPLNFALALEAGHQQQMLKAAGYASLCDWVAHQRRDIIDGRRDAPEELSEAGQAEVEALSRDVNIQQPYPIMGESDSQS
ncbi:hypothetical protein Pla22_45550 [Rubripirellula amarantea]|uniref:Uncharacterized protein n=1 Tax=Rubripirellula amarantea TaxID=2527999 RepID=A0A5C5WGX2_9BACT|nr:hypothetical protein [Rubripirellula amarantea]TWT49359.1 hypothetical protein Pla22_45550 [Rubripirellula amarantea]